MIAAELEKKLFFGAVKKQLPDAPPAANQTPQAFLALQSETMTGITNKEHESDLIVSVIVFVRSAKSEVDLEKLKAIDKAEEAIDALQDDTAFRAIASSIQVRNADYGPLALSSFGLDWAVLPPFGVIRLDVETNFIYQAIP
jgi:hypothetical protein